MAEQLGESLESGLHYVPREELERVLALDAPPAERAALFADLARINTLYMIARAGSGHIGSSFSSLDIVSWLHLEEMDDGDIYFSSKGHDAPGLYAAWIGLGSLPFELIHRLRRGDGLPGHPDIGTPGVATNTGSLGMGISKAKGIVTADRLSGRTRRVFVLMGDGELQEGQVWESLASAVTARMSEITVIVDHNKLQSDTFVSEVSDLGDIEAKFAAFGWQTARCDGHDFAALAAALAGEAKGPRVIVADTIKGRGVSFMEHTALGSQSDFYEFHSGAPSAEHYAQAVEELVTSANASLDRLREGSVRLTAAESNGAAPAAGSPQRLIAAYERALVEHAARDEAVVALDADLLRDVGLEAFRERFPERFIECGIAEQDMVSTAGGLARAGMLPVVHSFASFLSTRPNEQIFNNATESDRIVYVGSLAGVLPGGPGHSHQSVRDISTLASVPGMVLLQPATEAQVARAVEFALGEHEGSSYIRLVTVPVAVPFEHPDEPLRLGAGHVVAEGDGEVVVVAYGPVTLAQAYEAAERVRAEGRGAPTLVNLPWLNRIDPEWAAEAFGSVRAVVSVDDHALEGGQGQLLGACIAEQGSGARLYRAGVRGVVPGGSNDEVLRAAGLDSDTLAGLIGRAYR